MCIWRVAAVLNKLIWRMPNVSPSRGPSAMSNSTSVSASRQVWARPCSSIWQCSTNALASMSAVAPLRQVRVSNPAACRSANNVGDQPPRSNPTSTRRSSPTMARSWGSNRRSSAASEAAGSASTTSSGSPAASATQVSTVAGAGNFNRGTWVFAIRRVP